MQKQHQTVLTGAANIMILFHNHCSSTLMTVVVLALLIVSCIMSSLLNPIVFFYNKKKTSIAGLLFCVLSASDFLVCLLWPAGVLYYAATLDLTEMICSEKKLRQPQNCHVNATSVHITTTTSAVPFNSLCFLTTGFLAILRGIQIKFPFYPISKFKACLILFVLFLLQSTLWMFFGLSPLGEKYFYPAYYSAQAVNPFGLKKIEQNRIKTISIYISCIPLGITQIFASFATIITAVTLFKRRNSLASSNSSRNRTHGSAKVFLTNVFSLLYGLLLGTPMLFLVLQGNEDEVVSEKDGWVSFFLPVMFPILSSVWNPIVFVTLTKKSREQVLSMLTVIWRGSGVRPQM